MDLLDAHTQALGHTRRLVAGVRDDQWDQLSPCEGWSVRELVNHIVTGNFWAGELTAGKTIEEVGDRLDGDVSGKIRPRSTTSRPPSPTGRFVVRARWTRRWPCRTARCRARCTAGTASSTCSSMDGMSQPVPARTPGSTPSW
ncbi:MAG: maleylpyruvate isomerase N-terminal domain-containing protein [Acidimicrobiia bacterium]